MQTSHTDLVYLTLKANIRSFYNQREELRGRMRKESSIWLITKLGEGETMQKNNTGDLCVNFYCFYIFGSVQQ